MASCKIKHRPSKEPKFHKEVILAGVGNSTSEPLTIFKRGWVRKIDFILFEAMPFLDLQSNTLSFQIITNTF